MDEKVKGVTLHKNEFEDSLWYELGPHKVNLVAVHLPGEAHRFFIAAWPLDASLDDAPFSEHEMSQDEVCLRHNFYSQMAPAGWLEKSA